MEISGHYFLKGDTCSSSKKFQWDIHVNIWLQLYIVHVLRFKFWWGFEPQSPGKKPGVISIYTTRTFKHHIKHDVYMHYEKCLLFMEFNIHIHITKKKSKCKTEITIQPSCFLSEWSLPLEISWSSGDTCIFMFVFAFSGAIYVCRLLHSVDMCPLLNLKCAPYALELFQIRQKWPPILKI